MVKYIDTIRWRGNGKLLLSNCHRFHTVSWLFMLPDESFRKTVGEHRSFYEPIFALYLIVAADFVHFAEESSNWCRLVWHWCEIGELLVTSTLSGPKLCSLPLILDPIQNKILFKVITASKFFEWPQCPRLCIRLVPPPATIALLKEHSVGAGSDVLPGWKMGDLL